MHYPEAGRKDAESRDHLPAWKVLRLAAAVRSAVGGHANELQPWFTPAAARTLIDDLVERFDMKRYLELAEEYAEASELEHVSHDYLLEDREMLIDDSDALLRTDKTEIIEIARPARRNSEEAAQRLNEIRTSAKDWAAQKIAELLQLEARTLREVVERSSAGR